MPWRAITEIVTLLTKKTSQNGNTFSDVRHHILLDCSDMLFQWALVVVYSNMALNSVISVMHYQKCRTKILNILFLQNKNLCNISS